MIVSKLNLSADGLIEALVCPQPEDQQPVVEDYLNALDCAARQAGYHPAGRAVWRAGQQPGTLECTVAQLPDAVLSDYRGVVMYNLSASSQVDARRAAEQAAQGCVLELPEFAVEAEADFQWQQLHRRLEKSHITLQQHLARLHTTQQLFYEKLRGYARQDLQLRFALLAIARAEGFAVEDEALAAAVKQAQAHHILRPDRMQLRQQLLAQKAADLIWQNTTVQPLPDEGMPE